MLLQISCKVLPTNTIKVSILLYTMVELGTHPIVNVVVMMKVPTEFVVANQILEYDVEPERYGLALHFVQVCKLSFNVDHNLCAFSAHLFNYYSRVIEGILASISRSWVNNNPNKERVFLQLPSSLILIYFLGIKTI